MLRRSLTFFIFCPVSAFLLACTPQSSWTPLSAEDPKSSIVGGSEILTSEAFGKSIVAVYNLSEGDLCSGTLIDKNIVLTAAHCVASESSEIFVVVGQDLLDNSNYFAVDKVVTSPYWTTSYSVNLGDIALLKLKTPVPSYYQPAPLLPESLEPLLRTNSEVTVAGFGVTNDDGDGGRSLRKAQVKISDRNYATTEILIDQRTGQGVCHGDSGGPGFIEINGTQYLWGVTSRQASSENSNSCSTSTVFTNALFYRVWIDRMKQKLNGSLFTFYR